MSVQKSFHKVLATGKAALEIAEEDAKKEEDAQNKEWMVSAGSIPATQQKK